jgi:hypothetical protein
MTRLLMRASDLVELMQRLIEEYDDLRIADEEGAELRRIIYNPGTDPPITDSDYFEMRF